jgi:acyl-CoA-binding protein
MADLDERFEAAAEQAQRLKTRPDDQTLLRLYGLYKQATVGDVSGTRPGFDDIVGRFKHDAWSRLKGTPRAQAMQGYIDLVETLTS